MEPLYIPHLCDTGSPGSTGWSHCMMYKHHTYRGTHAYNPPGRARTPPCPTHDGSTRAVSSYKDEEFTYNYQKKHYFNNCSARLMLEEPNAIMIL